MIVAASYLESYSWNNILMAEDFKQVPVPSTSRRSPELDDVGYKTKCLEE